MTRVVVVEGRSWPRAAALLHAEGITVATTPRDANAIVPLVREVEPHLVLVEVVALTRAVVDLCMSVDAVSRAPILVCCEQSEEAGVVDALAAGVRIVVTEPVGSHELVARVRALLRRHQDESLITVSDGVVTVGCITLDREQHLVTVDGETVPVPPREFAIAELLMRRAGVVVTRELLMRELWGSTRFAASLAVQVGRLRARLAAIEGRPRIVTVRGVGYRFATDEDLARDDREEQVVADEVDLAVPSAPAFDVSELIDAGTTVPRFALPT
jgi:two-component system, OmpR family, response regulator RegX3